MSKDSTPAPEPKPLGRTNSGSAIVFDPVAQRITTEKISRLENHKPIKTAPKWFNHVEIYDEDSFKRHIVTLNLGKLSWATNMKRLCGKCNDIYIMELPDQPAAFASFLLFCGSPEMSSEKAPIMRPRIHAP